MNRTVKVSMLAAAAALLLGVPAAQAQQGPMSFFITSVGSGKGGDLGGLAGADAHCQSLAQAAGAGTRTWRAYLSNFAAPGVTPINARDRIGNGPWHNAKGELIAQNVDDLHSANNKINKETGLTEKGEPVKARGETPNMHDIMTGSQPDGRAFPAQHQRDLQQLDQQQRRQGAGRPPRPARHRRHRIPALLELIAHVEKLQPARPGRHRRRRLVLLLRGAVAAEGG